MRTRWTIVVILVLLGVVGGYFWQKQSGETYVIGCITPLTGEGATYGIATTRGIDLALDELQARKTEDDKLFSVRCEDSQINPRIATGAIQKLINIDEVPVILGAFGSSVTLAIAPIAERNKVVLLSASSTADAIKNAGQFIFRNVPRNNRQGDTAARFVRQRLFAQAVSILHMNNDYGLSLKEAFEAAFKTSGGRILSVESYNPGTTDFRAQLTKIRAQNPPVIFFPGHYQESGLILKQARELGIGATFIGGDGSYSPQLINIAHDAAEGSHYTLMTIGGAASVDKVKKFEQSYRVRFKGEPDVYSAYAYDAFLTIADAIKRGGYSGDRIRAALLKTNFVGVTGRTQFDDFGEVDKPFGVYVVKNGKFLKVQ